MQRVQDVKWDNKTNNLTVTLGSAGHYGTVDGAHTLLQVFAVLANYKEHGKELPANLTVEFIAGLPDDNLDGFSRARNTSMQVKEKSLADQANKFNPIKDALRAAKLDPDEIVAWHENDNGFLDVREVVALLALFELDGGWQSGHPVAAYYGKENTLKRFLADTSIVEPMFPIIGDILWLPELVRHYVPPQQIVNGSKFGNITGVRPLKTSTLLPITGLSTEHTIPDAYVYPLVAAFRAMIRKSASGHYEWAPGVDFKKAIEKDQLASNIFREGVFPTVQQLRNAMVVGKTVPVWGHTYMMAQVYAMTVALLRALLAGARVNPSITGFKVQ